MEEAIQLAEPAGWERHLRRRSEGGAGEVVPLAPAADAEEDDARASHGDPEEEFFGYDGPPGRDSVSVLGGSSADLFNREASRLKIAFEEDIDIGGQGDDDRTSGTASGLEGRDSEPSSLVQRLCAIDVCEVFSPPRVGTEAAKLGMKVGDAMDLTTGWDFNIPEHRRKEEEYIDREKQLVLIGSPPCVAFSPLQTLNPEGYAAC